MRLSSGFAKGMRLKSPKGSVTRPTPEKVRAAVFNSLALDLQDAYFLDLFAGTGAMGLEALSRGAAGACFVESDRLALECLRQNVHLLQGYAEAAPAPVKTEILSCPVERARPRLAEGFDFIWSDPPYAKSLEWVQSHSALISKWASSEGMWIIESAAKDLKGLESHLSRQGWALVKSKTYGITAITFWTRHIS